MKVYLVVRLFCSWCILMVINGMDTSNPCNYYRIGDGVCVCNVTYCDTLDGVQPICDKFTLITSSKSGKRFNITHFDFNSVLLNVSVPLNRWLRIDENQTYQTIIGFGGALTDAASLLIAAMNVTLREFVYNSYVSSTYGAAYQIIRIPIGGTDFSEKPWAYNEQPQGDTMLLNMTELDPLDRRRIDQIRELKALLPDAELKFMFCAWSPPPWMKSNKRWQGSSRLLTQYYATWALYHAKALNLWRNEGITAWSLSTGNEPIYAGYSRHMSLGWNAKDQKQWLTTHLKPILKQHGHNDVLIIGLDDQRSALLSFCRAFEQSASNQSLADLDLIGIHWYLDEVTNANSMDTVWKRYQVPIVYTESCEGAGLNVRDMVRGPKLGSWLRCHEYVHRMINNFNHGVSGFIDWNMVLDLKGGPNYARNFADAPMIFDQQNQTIYKQPMFYGIAHFSKFLQSNCTRINSNLSPVSRNSIEAVAFSCANSTKVIIMHNRSPSAERIALIDNNIGQLNLTLDASSVNTLVYQNC